MCFSVWSRIADESFQSRLVFPQPATLLRFFCVGYHAVLLVSGGLDRVDEPSHSESLPRLFSDELHDHFECVHRRDLRILWVRRKRFSLLYLDFVVD